MELKFPERTTWTTPGRFSYRNSISCLSPGVSFETKARFFVIPFFNTIAGAKSPLCHHFKYQLVFHIFFALFAFSLIWFFHVGRISPAWLRCRAIVYSLKILWPSFSGLPWCELLHTLEKSQDGFGGTMFNSLTQILPQKIRQTLFYFLLFIQNPDWFFWICLCWQRSSSFVYIYSQLISL